MAFSRADTSDSSRSDKTDSVCFNQAEKSQGATVRTMFLDATSLAIIVWFCLLVTTLSDLFARTDLCAWKKAIWAVAVLVVPMGALGYMAVQSRAITDRKVARIPQSERDCQKNNSNISDEISEAERLFPMIQQAIEIEGVLEAEDRASTMEDPDQIGVYQHKATSRHTCAVETNRSRPDQADNQGFPAVAA